VSDDAAPRLVGVGAYAPRTRLPADAVREAWGRFRASGIERVAVPDADEDVLTMGHEAARAALEAADAAPGDVTHLAVGTTTPPTAEESLPARLVSTLGLPASATTRQLGGSANAGCAALSGALDADLHDDAVALVVASDAPRGHPDSAVGHGAGAGAAAVVLAAEGPGVVAARASHTATYPGTRFRRAGSDETEELGVTAYARRAYREAVGGAVDGLARPPAVAAAAVGAPDGGLPYRVTDALGVESETVRAGATVHDLGDAGAATPLLGLARALDEGHESVLVVGYGSGSEATALVVRGSVPAVRRTAGTREVDYARALRLRGEVTSEAPAGGGAYVSVPSWRRTLPQRHRLVAGRCPDCGVLAFPPEGACPDCHALVAYDEVRLPGTGTVEAATVVERGGAPPEFAAQAARSGRYVSAVVAFDGPGEADGTVSVPVQVVDWTDRPAVGARVTATLRRVYEQEGVVRYGVKVRPVDPVR
jgi:hydroxymethylglutaryl-CoA synthase